MTYRLLVVVVAIALVLLLLLGFWLSARLFLERYGSPGDRQEQIKQLVAWNFAGFGLGLIVVGIGGPVLGTLAFTHKAGEMSGVSWPVAALWGAVANLLIGVIVGGALVALVLNQ